MKSLIEKEIGMAVAKNIKPLICAAWSVLVAIIGGTALVVGGIRDIQHAIIHLEQENDKRASEAREVAAKSLDHERRISTIEGRVSGGE